MSTIAFDRIDKGRSLVAHLPSVAGAAVLGLVLIWGAAFAPQAAVHNAAHDGRHVVAAPCH